MSIRLREGIYEHLLTREMSASLADLGLARAKTEALDEAELPRVLTRHLARELEARLRSAGDCTAQLLLANRVLGAMAEGDPLDAASSLDRPEQLLAIFQTSPPSRPTTPLAQSTLLTRGAKDPSLGHELQREIASADEICVIAAFITMSGIRLRCGRSSRRCRIGAARCVCSPPCLLAPPRCARWMRSRSSRGCEVRISYDVERTRLHAKAWLFSRGRGGEDLHTAYVGSANLTHTALSSGQEWIIKASAGDFPDVIRKFRGTFEGALERSRVRGLRQAPKPHRRLLCRPRA